MANNQFNIKELNYIARQIAHKFPDMPLSPTEIETLLPKDKQSAANEIFQEMKNFGLVNETSSKLDNIALLSVANVMYFNEDNALSPTERTEAQKVATQKLLSQQLQDLNSNEYFIIGGFKLHNDLNHGIVLSPVTGENTLPSPENVLSFLHENKIEVDLIDLTASTEQIEGDLKILDEQPEIQFVELQQHEPLHVMDFLSYSKSIEQQKDIYFYIKGVTDKNEIATRITQMNNIASGDIVLSQGTTYVFFEGPDKEIQCKAVPLNADAVMVENLFGIDISQEEMSTGDDVLGEATPYPENIAPSSTPNEVPQNNTPVDKTTPSNIEAEKRIFSNSPYFGDGVGNNFIPNDNNEHNQDFAERLNKNETRRVAAEIKINNLYAEKNRLKRSDKYKVRGLLGFFRNLLYRPIRNLIYFIARPFVKDLPMFRYNSAISDINNQIKDTKDDYFNAENQNNRLIKKEHIDITEVDKTNQDHLVEQTPETPVSPSTFSEPVPKTNVSPISAVIDNSEQIPEPDTINSETATQASPINTEHKISYPKMFKQIVEKVAPPNTSLHLTTQSNIENGKKAYTNNITFIRPDKNGGSEEIKLTMDKGDRELVSTTATDLSKETLSDLSERVLVAQQIAREKANQAGISESSWYRTNGSRPSKADMATELITGEAKVKNFFVNGIKTTVEVLDNGNISISSLGGNCEIARQAFVSDARDVINTITYNMAVNKYIGYMCEQLPQKLENSVYLDRVTDNSVSFAKAHLDFTKSGRPIVHIPMTITSPTQKDLKAIDLEIIIDTNSGKVQPLIPNNDVLSPQITNLIDQTIGITKGVYAGSLLSTVSSDVIYGEIYADRIRSDIQKVADTLAPASNASVFVCGLKVDVTKEASGTIKLSFEDTYGEHSSECICYNGVIPLTRAMQIQDVGRISMEQDKTIFESRESKASTTKMTDEIAAYIPASKNYEESLLQDNGEIQDFIFDEEISVDEGL